jgi:hypothetical protein
MKVSKLYVFIIQIIWYHPLFIDRLEAVWPAQKGDIDCLPYSILSTPISYPGSLEGHGTW